VCAVQLDGEMNQPTNRQQISYLLFIHLSVVLTFPFFLSFFLHVQISAVRTVPGGPSIACSTPRAIEWDASFKGRADCSGRAVAGVHADAYGATFGQK
jgi:hypothetical protein